MQRPILPIGSFIEAIENEQQHSPQLSGLHLKEPHNRRSYRLSDKEITFFLCNTQGEEWQLTLPLAGHFELPPREIGRRELLVNHSELFASAHYIPQALTLFDSRSEAHPCDGLLQRRHTPLPEFVRHNCSTARRGILRNALEFLATATENIPLSGLRHGELTPNRICFDTKGAPKLTDFPIVLSKGNDFERLAEAAVLIYIGASEPSAHRLLSQLPHSEERYERCLRAILSAAEYHGVDALGGLVRALLTRASATALNTQIAALSRTPFAPLPLLTSMLECRTENRTISTLPPQHSDPLPIEETPMVDFKLCDELLPASDQIVRFRKGDTWGYAHLDGRRIVVERTLLSARDFAECRAVIGTRRGYGLIDTSGRLIMNDVWEQLEWYGDENIVTAANQRGIWHIFDRMGRQLSAIGADWMGDAAEGFVVARKGDKYGYYSTDGAKRCDCIYDEAFSFHSGRALVCFKGSYYHIDTSLHRTSD